MLEIRNLCIKTKQDREIIHQLSFSLDKGDRLAIIGEEGNGKSTLLKGIYDRGKITSYAIIEGDIQKHGLLLGYLEQFLDSNWNQKTIEEYVLKESPEGQINYEQYAEIYKIENIFNQLGLNKEYLLDEKTVGTLSGGEKVKLQLAKLLWKNTDILLLDEPTNDLDIETLEWLENFLLGLTIPVIFISHDEVLLERVANCILHLEQVNNKTKAKHTYEHIGYTDYVEKRKDLISKQEQVAKNEEREHQKELEKYLRMYQQVRSDLESVSRQEPAKARLLKKKMKSVKSIGKKIEQEEISKRPYVEEAIVAKFHNEDDIHPSKVILDITNEQIEREGTILSKPISLNVIGKEKIVIIGENGVGKTTLLKKIYEMLKQRTDIQVGYMPQNYEELLPEEISPVQYLTGDNGKEEETIARTYMGSMKFTKEEMLAPICGLSGGQKAKLLLLKLIMQKSNVLLLDEPTRNLSPLSVPVINQLLNQFEGSIISVSHDRMYIRSSL